jgi:hypothetical protein
MSRYLIHYLRIATQYTRTHPRGALGIAGAIVGGVMAGAFDASSLLSGVALIWETVKAGYSAAVIASIIAAVRGSVKIVVHVRQTGNAVATVASATRQTMARAGGWPTALYRHLANAWSASPINIPRYRPIAG